MRKGRIGGKGGQTRRSASRTVLHRAGWPFPCEEAKTEVDLSSASGNLVVPTLLPLAEVIDGHFIGCALNRIPSRGVQLIWINALLDLISSIGQQGKENLAMAGRWRAKLQPVSRVAAIGAERWMMRQYLNAMLVVLVVQLIGFGAPPAAAVPRTFGFFQSGSTPPGSVFDAMGFITISEAAFQAGLNVYRGQYSGADPLAGSGIIGIDFRVTFSLPGLSLPVPYTLVGDFVEGRPIYGPFWQITLSSSPRGVPTGNVFFSNTSDSFDFYLRDPRSTGFVGTDYPGAVCHFGCSFAGRWEPLGFSVMAPEPATSGLLTAGVAGLIWIRRRGRNGCSRGRNAGGRPRAVARV